MLQVWHAQERGVRFFEHDGSTFPADFIHVATVRTENLGEAFQLTNHIDAPWFDNADAFRFAQKGARSTSVGDVLVNEAGERWLVAGVGFKAF